MTVIPKPLSALEVDPVEPDAALPAAADVVVIGGGIVGTSAALALAERGISVVLCEKGRIGGEQSGRNWGWVRQMGREPSEIPLAMESVEIWRGLNERLGAETGYRRTGILYVCATEREVAEYEAWLEHARGFDLPSRLLSRDEVLQLAPNAAAGIRAGLYTATDGRGEPTKAAAAMARGVQQRGGKVLTNTAVRGIETHAGSIAGVVTEHGPIRAKAVILAGGAWSRLFAGNLGIDFPQLKILGSAARVDNVPDMPELPIGGGNFAFRKRLDGGYTVAMRNADIAPITPDSFRLFWDYLPTLARSWRQLRLRLGTRFIEEWQTPRQWRNDEPSPFERVRVLDPAPEHEVNRAGLRNLIDAFPGFASAQMTHSWSGIIDVTPDAVPVIDNVPSIPGLVIASGFSGHGFGIGPAAGKLAADLAIGVTPSVDPSPFRLSRFTRLTKSAARVAATTA